MGTNCNCNNTIINNSHYNPCCYSVYTNPTAPIPVVNTVTVTAFSAIEELPENKD